jgi:hypothetical protein
MTEFDFDAKYRIGSWGDIAWRVLSYATHQEPIYSYTEEDEIEEVVDWEEVEDQTRVVCVMVGDDHKFTFDVDELTKLEDEDYCSCCGQIGCLWG